jgi:ABC-type protease/lipase transport system fused ATPase/permease subunit
MREGRMEAFGPRDEVMAKIMKKPVPIDVARQSPRQGRRVATPAEDAA